MSAFLVGISCILKNTLKRNYLQNYVKKKEARYLFHSRKFFSNQEKCDWDFIDLSPTEYDRVCSETLDGLSDYFEELVEAAEDLESTDVAYSDGVLTVNLDYNGTYVINRQTPNKQIWLSSPRTGPKRFDFFGTENAEMGEWIYRHTGENMHNLLQDEIKTILKRDVNFFQLPYAGQ